jgi:hypothetical protein
MKPFPIAYRPLTFGDGGGYNWPRHFQQLMAYSKALLPRWGKV